VTFPFCAKDDKLYKLFNHVFLTEMLQEQIQQKLSGNYEGFIAESARAGSMI